MGKYLRLFFGCHARADRSFFFRGKQFPICARCTGELCGMLLAIPFIGIIGYIPLPWCFIFTIPLIIDGTMQLKTKWVSNNYLRLVTGILFGLAVGFILFEIHIFISKLAVVFLETFQGNNPVYHKIISNLINKSLIK